MSKHENHLKKINRGNRSKEIEVPEGSFCEEPWIAMRMDKVHVNRSSQFGTFDVIPCCGGWHRKPFGSYTESESLKDIINSDDAKMFRMSILDGSFRYCHKNVCPRIISKDIWPLKKKEDIKDPYIQNIIKNNIIEVDHLRKVSFDWDPSCNLKCPSCRIEKIQHKKGTGPYNKLKQMQEDILDFIFSTTTKDTPMIFNITGTGDAIGSTLYREWLQSFDGKEWPNIELNLMTNGVMLTPNIWKTLHKCHNNITRIDISIDAGNEEAYNKTRVGGNWNVLMKNLKFLSDENMKREKPFILRLMAIVQKNNYKSMPDLVRLAEKHEGISYVNMSRVFNWGTWSPSEFEDHAIWKDNHSDYNDFEKVFSDPIFRSKKVQDKVNYDKNDTL